MASNQIHNNNNNHGGENPKMIEKDSTTTTMQQGSLIDVKACKRIIISASGSIAMNTNGRGTVVSLLMKENTFYPNKS
jgi:hypothetical protein